MTDYLDDARQDYAMATKLLEVLKEREIRFTDVNFIEVLKASAMLLDCRQQLRIFLNIHGK